MTRLADTTMAKRAQCALVLLAMLCESCGLDMIIDEPPDIVWCVSEGALHEIHSFHAFVSSRAFFARLIHTSKATLGRPCDPRKRFEKSRATDHLSQYKPPRGAVETRVRKPSGRDLPALEVRFRIFAAHDEGAL